MKLKVFDIDVAAAGTRIAKALAPSGLGAFYSEVGGRVAKGSITSVGNWAAKSPLYNSSVDLAAGLLLNAGAYKFVYQGPFKMKKAEAQNFAMIAAVGSALWSFSPSVTKYVDMAATKVASLLPNASKMPQLAAPQSQVLTMNRTRPQLATGGYSSKQNNRASKRITL